MADSSCCLGQSTVVGCKVKTKNKEEECEYGARLEVTTSWSSFVRGVK